MSEREYRVGNRVAAGFVGAGLLVMALVDHRSGERDNEQRAQQVEQVAAAMAQIVLENYEEHPEEWTPNPVGSTVTERTITSPTGETGKVTFTHNSVVGPRIGVEDVSQVFVGQYAPGQFSNEFGVGETDDGWVSMAGYSGSSLSFYYFGAGGMSTVSRTQFVGLAETGYQELKEVLDGHITEPQKPENLPY